MALPKMFLQVGADTGQFESGMSRVIDATNQLQSKMKLTIDASGRLRDRFGQTVRVTEKLENAMRAAGVDVELVSDAMADLMANSARTRDALQNVANTTKRASVVAGQAVNDNSRFTRSIQNASFQLGDFATQVGAGTSASIALGQQLPQLLGGFGALGAVLGAVVAIGVPLARVMGDLADQGKDMTSIFGELQPAARALGDALVFVKDVGIVAIEAVINNIDQLLITAGLAAAYFAGPLVASFVAARVAAFSLAGALGVLRTALIRTGFGTAVVAAGYLAERFLALARAAGSFGEAMSMVADMIAASFAYVWQSVRAGFFEMWATIMSEAAIGLRALGLDTMADMIAGSAIAAAQAWGEAERMAAAFEARHDSIAAKIADLLSATDGQRIRLRDLFGGGGEEGEGDAAKDERQQLLDRVNAVRESLMTETELRYQHYLKNQELLEEALEKRAITEQTYMETMEALRRDHLGTVEDIERQKGQKALSQTVQAGQMIASAVAGNNKKVMAAARALGMFEALVNAYRAAAQTLADPTLPWFAKAAAAASVLATGIGFVSSIAGIAGGGGGGGGGGAGQPARSAPPPATP